MANSISEVDKCKVFCWALACMWHGCFTATKRKEPVGFCRSNCLLVSPEGLNNIVEWHFLIPLTFSRLCQYFVCFMRCENAGKIWWLHIYCSRDDGICYGSNHNRNKNFFSVVFFSCCLLFSSFLLVFFSLLSFFSLWGGPCFCLV